MGKQNNTVKFAVPGFFGRSGVPLFQGVRCSGVFQGVPVFLVLVHAVCFAVFGQKGSRGQNLWTRGDWK